MEINTFFFNLGLLIIRLGVGMVFVKSGAGKMLAGTETLISLGKTMEYIGIRAYPLFWGICAMLTELLGGSFLIIGFLTRPAALILAFSMFMAILHHFYAGDSWQAIMYPFSYLLICAGIFFAGPGAYVLIKFC
jgi:putative oxidoreductase